MKAITRAVRRCVKRPRILDDLYPTFDLSWTDIMHDLDPDWTSSFPANDPHQGESQ